MSADPAGRRVALTRRFRVAWWESRVWLAADPAFFAVLRLTGRFAVVGLGSLGVLVNDARVGRAILLDPERFRTVGPGTHGELINEVMGPRGLLNMDGAEHGSLRRTLAGLFAAEPSARLAEETAVGPIAEAAGRLAAGEAVDLSRLIRIVTGRTAYALLGAPDPPDGDEGYLRMYHTGEELLAMTTDAARHGIRPERKRRALELVETLAEGARSGWESGGDSALARLRGLGLEYEEAKALVVIIILAGTETVSSGLPRSIALLLDSGAWAGIPPDDPRALDAAIDACLRLVTPSPMIVRSCIEPCEVGGHRFRSGQRILLSVYGMTRTPALFPGRDPEALAIGERLDRDLRHLWFGAGPHFCIGSLLARAQLRAMFGMLRAQGDLTIVRRRPARRVLFPSYAQLVVRRS
jgi:cytochrome P450